MQLLALLHRWTGGFAGLLLAVIGLSGTVLVWEGAWVGLPGANDRVANDPAMFGAAIEAALAERPGLTRITFASEELGLHHAAYEDGGGAYFRQDGAVVAIWDTMWARPELWLFDLHHYLLVGESGKYATGALGILLVAFTVTGLILWWRTRKTFKFRLWPARLTRSAIVRQHRDIGVVAAPFLLLTALTGTFMVFPAISDVLTAPWADNETVAPKPPEDLGPVGPRTDWAQAMDNAQAAFPDAAPRRLMFPAPSGSPLTLRLKQPFEWTPNGRTYVWLDPADGAVLGVDDPAIADTASAIAEKFYPVHAGKVGGLLWQLALTFCGLALTLLGTLATWSFWFRPISKAPARPTMKVGLI
ncbi:PepSY-associated TM helix domain-containing protein [Tsuneonella sp. HG222]